MWRKFIVLVFFELSAEILLDWCCFIRSDAAGTISRLHEFGCDRCRTSGQGSLSGSQLPPLVAFRDRRWPLIHRMHSFLGFGDVWSATFRKMRHLFLEVFSLMGSQVIFEILFNNLLLNFASQGNLFDGRVVQGKDFFVACGFLGATFTRIKLFAFCARLLRGNVDFLGNMYGWVRCLMAFLVGPEQVLQEWLGKFSGVI